MKETKEDVSNKVSQEQIDACITILEKLVGDTNQVFELPEEKRVALMTAAGLLTRPNRDEFSRRKKDAKKAVKRKMIARDKHARKETGIRSAREASVFVAPLMIDLTGEKNEKELEKEGADVLYPSFDEIRAEDAEGKAALIWQIYDASGNEIRRMKSSPKKGIQRQVWDLRTNSTDPIGSRGSGFLVTPGKFAVSVSYVKDGSVEALIVKEPFIVKGLNNQTLLAENPEFAPIEVNLEEQDLVIEGLSVGVIRR